MMIDTILKGHSKAVYSTWMLYKPANVLFDCGEAVALALGSKIFGIETICLGHGHLDHIMGLPGLFFARSASKGDNAKPLTVIHPKGDRDISRIKKFIAESFLPPHELKFQVTWIEMEPGQELEVSGRRLRAFETEHDPSRLTIGYEFHEKRSRLRDDLSALDGEDRKNAILAARERGESVNQETWHPSFVYTGDTIVRDLPEYSADVVAHEATFLNREDVKYNSHSLVEDVFEVMKKRKPGNLVLLHFSTRYSAAMCDGKVLALAKEMQLPFPVWVQYGDHLWRSYDPEATDEEVK